MAECGDLLARRDSALVVLFYAGYSGPSSSALGPWASGTRTLRSLPGGTMPSGSIHESEVYLGAIVGLFLET